MLKRIRKYEIRAEIGSGGFGRVFQAWDPDVGRAVAIKVLNTAGDRNMLQRFQNEAAAAGRLQHKNIVTVYEFGESEGMPYLVMELLEGQDLSAVMRGTRKLSLFEKVRIMTDVAEGLNAAHRTGITHRDVKPANVMVLPDGSAKIMDFGIARLSASPHTNLTQQGFIMGTLPYMSPEQLLRAETDTLTDIFAFGVIYYELIAGVHPFSSEGETALMYNIVNKEAEPLLSYAPDCPVIVAQAIHHAIQKDRDLRYQSIEDLLLDSQPGLFELQARAATNMLTEARQLRQANDLEAALARTRQVLELDPRSSPAKALRETLLTEIRVRTVRPRIEALTKSGQEHLDAGKFREALTDFETALNLDRSSETMQALVQRARNLTENSDRVLKLIERARHALSQSDLSEAFKSISDALTIDPANNTAQHLLDSVRTEMDRREQARRLSDGLRKVKGLLLMHSWDEGIALLRDLDEAYPNEIEVRTLLDRAHQQKAAEERRKRFESGLAEIQGLLGRRALEEAVQRAEIMAQEFQAERDVAELLAYARSELRADQRTAALADARAKVADLVSHNQYDPALELLNRAHSAFPEEGQFSVLTEETLRAKEAWERQKQIADAERRSVELTQAARFEDALKVVDSALQRFPGDASLTKARQATITAWEWKKRSDAIERVATAVKSLIAEQNFEPAIAQLKRAMVQFAANEELGGLLNQAEQGIAAQKAEKVLKALAEAKEMAARANFDGAVKVLESALQAQPNHPALLEGLEQIRTEQAAWEHEQKIVTTVARAGELRGLAKFSEALETIQDGIKRLGADPRFDEARRQIEAAAEEAKKVDFVHRCIEYARGLENANRLDDAVATLAKALTRYPAEPHLTTVLQEMENTQRERRRAAAIEETCKRAAALRDQHDYPGAIAVLEHALQTEPQEPRFHNALAETRAAEEAWKQEQTVAQACAQSAEHASQGRGEESVRVLEEALSRYPRNAALQEARKNAIAAWERKKRSDEIEKVADSARELASHKLFDQAISLLQQAIQRYGAGTELNPLLAQIRDEGARARTAAIDQVCQQIEAAISNKDFAAAARFAAEGLQAFPKDAKILKAQQKAETERVHWEREQAISAAVHSARDLSQQSRFTEAIRVVDEAERKLGRDTRLEAEKKSAQAELDRLQRLEAGQKLLKTAQELVNARRLSEAIDLLKRGVAEFPDQSEIAALLAKVEQLVRAEQAAIAQACKTAAELRQKSEFKAAIDVLNRQLEATPNEKQLLDAVAQTQAAEQQWLRQQALAETIRKAQELLDKTDIEGAAALLETGEFSKDPALDPIRQRVAAARQKRDRDLAIARAAAEARDLLEKGSFDEAERTLTAAIQAHAAADALGGLLKQVRQAKADHERAQQVERLRAEVQTLLDKSDFDKASRRLQSGLQSWPDEAVLVALHNSIEQARAAWEAKQAAERQRAEEERRKLNESLQQFISEGQPAKGVALIQEALAKNPADTELRVLLSFGEEAVRAQARIERLDMVRKLARKFLAEKAYPQAIAALEDAARQFPNEASLQRLLQQARAEQEEANRAKLAAAAPPPAPVPVPQPVPPPVQVIATPPPPAPAPAPPKPAPPKPGSKKDARRKGQPAPAAPPAAPPPPPAVAAPVPPPPPQPVMQAPPVAAPPPRPYVPQRDPAPNRTPIYIGIAAAAVLAVIAGVLIFKPGGGVEIVSEPTGAAITVGTQSCATPNCKLNLAPGDYELHAQKDGYQPLAKLITIEKKQSGPIALTLDPIPAGMTLSTNLERGRVRVNGEAQRDLQNGQFSVRNLKPGENRIEIEGEGARSTVAVTVLPGAAPRVTSVEASGGATVLAVGAAGKQASLRCQCDLDPATLDGRAIGDIRSSEAHLDTIADGPHKVTTKFSGVEYEFVFSASARPEVDIFMRTGKNSGDLVVLTPGQEGVTVLVNGKNSGETSDRGALTLSLPPQSYTVAVEKKGFQRPPSQKGDVRRGSTRQLTFDLIPDSSILQITDATPGAVIVIDGTEAGVVSNDGRANVPVQPGSHDVAINRPGFRSFRNRITFEAGKPTALGSGQAQLAPDAPPPPDPNQVRAQEWASLQNSRDIQALDGFRRKYPNTQEAEQANRRIQQLAWEAVNQNDANALRAYIQQFPGSPNAADAQRALDRIDQAKRADEKSKRDADEAKRLADDQAAKQRAEDQAKQEQAKQDQAKRAADIQAITKAFTLYESAYQQKNPDALMQVWPSISRENADKAKAFFHDASEVRMSLQRQGDPEFTSNGNKVSLLAIRTLSGKAFGRTVPPASDRVRIVLTRTSSGWIIESIEPIK